MSFSPKATFPSNCSAISLWAVISSTDKVGIVVDNLKKGDLVEIESISGTCSFKKGGGLPILAGFVALAGGILQDGLSYYTEGQSTKTNEAIGDQTKVLQNSLNKNVSNARRDGYGQDPGTGDFGKNEGGVIMCMPKSHGAVYAVSDNYLLSDSKGHGRLTRTFPRNINHLNCWFPSRRSGGIMSKTVEVDGPLHMLAFDEKFSDNAGTYTIKVHVTRPGNSKLSAPQLKSALFLAEVGLPH